MKIKFTLTLVLKVILFVIASWLFVHLFGILGIFVALSYPIWFIFSPRSIICLGCINKKEGERCKFCNSFVTNNEKYPKNLKSLFLNFLVILSISIISTLMIFIEYKVLIAYMESSTPRTAYVDMLGEKKYYLDQILPMEIEIRNIKTAINAVQIDLSFDPRIFQVVDIVTTNSFASLFVEKTIDNENGYLRISGGLPNPGYMGDNGLFCTIILQAISPGVSEMRFLPTSLVLANDGKGTNIIKDMPPIAYLVLPEELPDDIKEKQLLLFDSYLREQDREKEDKIYLFAYDAASTADILGAQDDRVIGVKYENTCNTPKGILGTIYSMDKLVVDTWTKTLEKIRTTVDSVFSVFRSDE